MAEPRQYSLVCPKGYGYVAFTNIASGVGGGYCPLSGTHCKDCEIPRVGSAEAKKLWGKE